MCRRSTSRSPEPAAQALGPAGRPPCAGRRRSAPSAATIRSPPIAMAADGSASAPTSSSVQAGPTRGQLSSVPSRMAPASATTTQPNPKMVAAAPATASVPSPSAGPADLREHDDAAPPGSRAVFALAGHDQPRGDVGDRAEPEQRGGEQEAGPHMGRRPGPSVPPGRRSTPPSQRPRRGRERGCGRVGARRHGGMVSATAADGRRDRPQAISGIPRTQVKRPSSMIGSPSAVSRPPRRRSQIMSQWTADSLMPPVSGYERPTARWTVPPIFSSNRIAPTGRSMPKLVPIRSRRAATRRRRWRASSSGTPRRARRARTRRGPRGTRARCPRPRRRRGSRGSCSGCGPRRVLVRAGEDLAGGHVALAVGVDPRAALDVEREVGALGLDAQLARAGQALDQPRLEFAQLAPRAGGVVAVEEQRALDEVARTRWCPSRPPGRPPPSATASTHQRRLSAASRTFARARAARAIREASTPTSARVFSGAWMRTEASVPSASASSDGGNESRCTSRAARQNASSAPGSEGAHERPRLALEQHLLQRQQQRRGERRGAHGDLLARLDLEAVVRDQLGEAAGVRRHRSPPRRGTSRRRPGRSSPAGTTP